MTKLTNNWWGEFDAPLGKTIQWQIGHSQIAVQRLEREWLVGQTTMETEEEQQEWDQQLLDIDLNDSDFSSISRFVFFFFSEKLTVLPALGDRSVVIRPITPFTIPAGEQTTIYVTSLLWFTLTSGPSTSAWFETPIQRPSDTWFGPSTMDGEVCYASRTYGRMDLEKLTNFPHRAFTQIDIQNKNTSPLVVERLNLPVPYLSLFQTDSEMLWTETVTIVQGKETLLAEFNIQDGPPASQNKAELIAAPRQAPQKGMIIRAFSALRRPRAG